MTLHGRGNQYKLTKTYEEKRNKAMKYRFDFTDEELGDLDISFPDGGGKDDPEHTYIRYNVPIPADRKKEKIDLRDFPRYGFD